MGFLNSSRYTGGRNQINRQLRCIQPTCTTVKRPQREENLNTFTHAVGIGLSLIALYLIWSRLGTVEDSLVQFACVGFGLALICVYTCSTLSHYFTDPPRQTIFRQLDQAFIYILIVASYSPFSVVFLRSPWWWSVLGVMWIIALAGFVSKLFLAHRLQRVSIWLYLLLGWVPAAGGMPFTVELPWGCRLWILYGGIAYTVGTYFLFNDKKFWFFHGIWHIFVIAGSACHVWAVLKFVLTESV